MYIIKPLHFCEHDTGCDKRLENEEISLVFHKIVSWIKESYEVLTRVWDNKMSPEPMLRNACINTMKHFDYRVFDLVFNEFNKYIDKYWSIHINIFPFTLREHDFIEQLKVYFSKYYITDTSKIYFEIIENWFVKKNNKWKLEDRYKKILWNLNKNIEELHKFNIKVWLDDYPEWNSGILLEKLENLDFVKIDKKFLLNNWDDFVKWVSDCISNIKKFHPNAVIIIEWVEKYKYIETLRELWIDSFQWYYFWKPEKYNS